MKTIIPEYVCYNCPTCRPSPTEDFSDEAAVDSFLPSYRDPIFSIILILLIAVAIALAAYGWNLYRQERLSRKLFSFLDRFDSSECTLEESDMPFEERMARPLLLLAKAFEQSGEYAKTISILLYLIRHTRDDELMIYLGRVYLRAGFLQRAEDLFLEVISRLPRRKDLLYQLELLYEKMRDYGKAREALEALRAQGEETRELSRYLEYRELLEDHTLSTPRKVERLRELYARDPRLHRAVLSRLFPLDTRTAWSLVDTQHLEEILDILWYLPPSQLQLDIISANERLRGIYFARGDLEEGGRTGIFALEMLQAARRGGFRDGDLAFGYLCSACKQSFPLSFERCPGCMALHSLRVEETLVARNEQEDNPLF